MVGRVPALPRLGNDLGGHDGHLWAVEDPVDMVGRPHGAALAVIVDAGPAVVRVGDVSDLLLGLRPGLVEHGSVLVVGEVGVGARVPVGVEVAHEEERDVCGARDLLDAVPEQLGALCARLWADVVELRVEEEEFLTGGAQAELAPGDHAHAGGVPALRAGGVRLLGEPEVSSVEPLDDVGVVEDLLELAVLLALDAEALVRVRQQRLRALALASRWCLLSIACAQTHRELGELGLEPLLRAHDGRVEPVDELGHVLLAEAPAVGAVARAREPQVERHEVQRRRLRAQQRPRALEPRPRLLSDSTGLVLRRLQREEEQEAEQRGDGHGHAVQRHARPARAPAGRRRVPVRVARGGGAREERLQPLHGEATWRVSSNPRPSPSQALLGFANLAATAASITALQSKRSWHFGGHGVRGAPARAVRGASSCGRSC